MGEREDKSSTKAKGTLKTGMAYRVLFAKTNEDHTWLRHNVRKIAMSTRTDLRNHMSYTERICVNKLACVRSREGP